MSSSTASTSADSGSARGRARRGVTRRRPGLYGATLAAAGAFTLALDLLNALVWRYEGCIVTYRGMALVALGLGVAPWCGRPSWPAATRSRRGACAAARGEMSCSTGGRGSIMESVADDT